MSPSRPHRLTRRQTHHGPIPVPTRYHHRGSGWKRPQWPVGASSATLPVPTRAVRARRLPCRLAARSTLQHSGVARNERPKRSGVTARIARGVMRATVDGTEAKRRARVSEPAYATRRRGGPVPSCGTVHVPASAFRSVPVHVRAAASRAEGYVGRCLRRRAHVPICHSRRLRDVEPRVAIAGRIERGRWRAIRIMATRRAAGDPRPAGDGAGRPPCLAPAAPGQIPRRPCPSATRRPASPEANPACRAYPSAPATWPADRGGMSLEVESGR